MADFFRPEARAALWRWREVIGGVALGLFGLWWLVTANGLILSMIGAVFIGLGAAFVWIGIARARFRHAGSGPGVVEVVERRLVYYGPLTGGAVDLADIRRVEHDPTAHPAPHWIVTDIYGREIAIPANADGADALLDAFATLPGLSPAHLAAQSRRKGHARRTVWDRPHEVLQ